MPSQTVALVHRGTDRNWGVILTATHGGPKRSRYALGLCASMMLVPAACVGSDLGDGSDAASFDLSYGSSTESGGDIPASVFSQVALAANTHPSPRMAAVRTRPAGVSGAVSAGSALAQTVTQMEAAPPSTSPTTVLVGSEADDEEPTEETAVAAPARPESSAPVALNLNIGSALRNLTGAGEQGEASWFHAPDGTCAHQTLPFGTLVKVTNVIDGTSTTCEVDDRGPFIDGRVIDLSYDVFEELAHPGSGVIDVVIEW